MKIRDFKTHIIDLAKGMLAAALMGAVISVLNYVGAQIPLLLEALSPAGAAVVAIKAMRSYG